MLLKDDKVLSEVAKGVRFGETNKNPIIKTEEKPNSFLENTNTEKELSPEEIKEKIKKIREKVIDKIKK